MLLLLHFPLQLKFQLLINWVSKQSLMEINKKHSLKIIFHHEILEPESSFISAACNSTSLGCTFPILWLKVTSTWSLCHGLYSSSFQLVSSTIPRFSTLVISGKQERKQPGSHANWSETQNYYLVAFFPFFPLYPISPPAKRLFRVFIG